jgi:WD40 repeat protein
VLRQSWAEQPHTLSGLAWHPNLTGQFATTSYSELVRWKVGQQEAARRFRWKGSLLGLSWSPDARYIATATQDATVHIWEAKTGQDMEMAGYATKVQSLSWSADGRYLATDGSTDVAVWDCGGKGPAGREPLLLNGHEGVIRALAFAPKAAWVASGCQLGDLCVWDLVAKKPLYTAIQDNAFSCLRWKPDASIVISGDCLGQVTAWSLPIHKTTI